MAGSRSDGKPPFSAVFAFTSRDHTPVLVGGIFCAAGAGIVKPALAILLGFIFDDLTGYGTGNWSSSQLLDRVSTWTLALVILGVFTALFNGGFFFLWVLFGELQAKQVRNCIFSDLLGKEMEWFDLHKDGTSTLTTRIQTQTRELQMATSQPMGLITMDIVTMFAATGVALYESWNLTLAILAIIPVATIMIGFITTRIQPAIEAQKGCLSLASTYAHNAITQVDTVKAFNAQDHEAWQYADMVKAAGRYYVKQAKASAFQMGIARFVIMAMFVQGFWYGIYLVDRGTKPGTILTAFYSCLQATQCMEAILPQWLVLTKGVSAGSTLRNILDDDSIVRSTTSSKQRGTYRPAYVAGNIEVKKVTFAYPSNPSQPVLRDVSLFFPAGETTFVIGRSGSGKSTLGNLILRFYEPNSGCITLDGQPLELLQSKWLCDNATLVQQQSSIFDDTVSQNILLGRRSNQIVTEKDVEQACSIVMLYETLRKLPNGIDTKAGRDGKNLSGGQKQRIALARARLRDAPILILDESTSALDPTSRIQIMRSIREWRKHRTTIIITHDISQIQSNDFVYVLENSELVEQGYRNNLELNQNGRFNTFVTEDAVQLVSQDQFYGTTPLTPYEDIASPHSPGFSPIESSVGTAAITRILGSNNEHTQRLSWNGGIFLHPGLPYYRTTGSNTLLNNHIADLIAPFEASSLRLPSSVLDLSGPSRRYASVVDQKPLNQPETEYLARRAASTLNTMTLDRISCRNKLQAAVRKSSEFVHDQTSEEAILLEERQGRSSSPKGRKTKERVPKKGTSLSQAFISVWPTLDGRDKVWLILAFCCACGTGVATPAFSYLFAELLGTFYLTVDRMEQARSLSIAILCLALFDGFVSFQMHFLFEFTGQTWVNYLRIESLRRVLLQPKSWFDKKKNDPCRINECLDRNGEEMRNLVGRFVGYFTVVIVMVTISIIWSLIACWKLALVCLSSLPVVYGLTRTFESLSGKYEKKSNESASSTLEILQETLHNIRAVRSYSLEHYFLARYRHAVQQVFQVGVRKAIWTGTFFGLSQSTTIFITALIFYYGSILISHESESLDDMLEASTLLLFGIGNANAIISYIPQISSALVTARYMLYLANLPPHASFESRGKTLLQTPLPAQLNNVEFSYPSRSRLPILRNLSIKFEAGSCTAITGSSGCGKSTLAQLLLGLYAPNQAILDVDRQLPALTFAGTSIFDCHIPSLRQQVIFVSQTAVIFPTTVAENIAYGLRQDSVLRDQRQIQFAAKAARIHEFIESMPQGYKTLIGDGGQGLSGGQAQRLAIARALLRRPKLLVLDEATSALDAENAELVRQTISSLITIRGSDGRHRVYPESDMAVVMITHNVEMMRLAQKVVYLDKGRIAEAGTFEGLMSINGNFARFISGGD